jgi:hypothetical protein
MRIAVTLASDRPDGIGDHDESDGPHRLSMTILMTPDMSNFAGNVHGGLLLKYLDQVAYTCATRYARNYAVTLSRWSPWVRTVDPSRCLRCTHERPTSADGTPLPPVDGSCAERSRA